MRIILFLLALLTGPVSAQVGPALGLAGGPGKVASVSYTGPADIVASPTACYSLRACSSALRGHAAINVCNVSDVTCADLLTDATTGALDVTTIGGSSCSIITCTVKIVYDQTGNGNDFTQTTIANRATLSVSCNGSLPCLVFASGDVYLKTGFNSATNIAQPLTLNTVVKDTGSSTVDSGGIIVAWDGVKPSGMWSNDGSANLIEIYFSAGSALSVTATNNAWHIFTGVAHGPSPNSNMNVDGTDHTGGVGTYVFSQADVYLGSDNYGSSFIGQMTEVVIWPSALSSGNITSLCHNQYSYWGTGTSC